MLRMMGKMFCTWTILCLCKADINSVILTFYQQYYYIYLYIFRLIFFVCILAL